MELGMSGMVLDYGQTVSILINPQSLTEVKGVFITPLFQG
jgi:hypothetical protein